MPDKLRIAAIHAHPDDLEILAAGTLALLAGQGHAVTMVTMTGGDCGSAEHSPADIARIRKAEAASAAAVIGAAYRWAGFQDLCVFNDDVSRRRATEVLRELQPDVVITASPVDYHCDHEATSVLVRDACFSAVVPNYRTGSAPPLANVPHLYFADPIEGMDREGNVIAPRFTVDVEKVFETKKTMLACHESQREWLRRAHHMDNYIEEMEKWCRARGECAGVRFGEGFRAYHCHPFPRTPLLEQLLSASLAK